MRQVIAITAPTIGRSPTSPVYTTHKATVRTQTPVGSETGLSVSRYLRMLLPVAGTLTLSVLVAVALIYFREPMSHMGNWGYLGVFAAEMGNSAAIIIPTPGHVVTLTLAPILNPLLVGLIGGIAAAIGELSGYALGATGRKALEGSRIYDLFQILAQRRVGLVLFACAALPVPFDFAGIWAGTVRYSLRHFLLYVTAGKIIRVTTFAFAGYYGMNWLIGSFGLG